MVVIKQTEIAEQKILKLKQGYTAFVESDEIYRMVKRRIEQEQLDVIIEETDIGIWLTPRSVDEKDK